MFTAEELEELKTALIEREKSVKEYASHYPDGGYSKQQLEKTEKLCSSIFKKALEG